MNQIKRAVFEKVISDGEIGVQFDADTPGILIPEHLDPKGQHTFIYGLAQPRPIPDLRVDDAGIHATLIFGIEWILTFVPWPAVVAMTGSMGLVIFLTGRKEDVERGPTPTPKLRLVPECASER